MMYKLSFYAEAKDEYDKLEGHQKKHIDKGLNKIIERGMSAGHPLEGDLSHCRKIKHRQLGLRIILKQSEKCIEIIEIVAIGKRDKKSVYKNVDVRLKNSRRQ